MVLEETDGLPDDFCIDLISQIGDTRNPRVLHQHVAKIFRDALPDKYSQNRDREKRPDAMNPGRKEGVQINCFMSERILDQEEPGIGSTRIEDAVKNRGN